MRPLRIVPNHTSYDFVRRRLIAFAASGLLLLIAVLSLGFQGLNLGIDFEGGVLIEAVAPEPVDIGVLRSSLAARGLGQAELQHFGNPNTLLIRMQLQDEGEGAEERAAREARAALGPEYEYRRVEFVGPKVGAELLRDGALATVLALAAIAAYVTLRFEWQFGVAALVATFHDVAATVGLFSILQLEFSLPAIAALLTVAGYSINDTVVIFDRVRENLRRRKTTSLAAILNVSINQTLARTIFTSGSTLLAVIPLLLLGGAPLFNFSLALAWGIIIGTYSSIFMAGALLLYLPPVGRSEVPEKEDRM